MHLLDSLKKKKKQGSDASIPLVNAASLLPDDLYSKPQESPPKGKGGKNGEREREETGNSRDLSGKHITGVHSKKSAQIGSSEPQPKRKYRIRRFKRGTGQNAVAHSSSHHEGHSKTPSAHLTSSDSDPTDPHDLIESSHMDHGKRESLYKRLRSIPRGQIISTLTIPNDLEAIEKLSERVTSVHSIHDGGEYDQLTVIQSGINEVSRNSQALASIAGCLHLLKGDEHRNQGDLIAAYSAYDQALKFASAGAPDDSGILSALRLELGNISLERDDIDSALTHYQKAHDLSGGETGPLLNLAVAHAMKNDHTTSRRFIDRSLKHDPEDADALFVKGVLHYFEGDTSAAIDTWQRTQDLEPANNEIRKYIGRFYLDIGDFRKAINSLELIVREHPDDLDVWNLLGLAYTELGDAEHAVTSYQRGLGVDDSGLISGIMAGNVSNDFDPISTVDSDDADNGEPRDLSESETGADQAEGSGAGGEKGSEDCWNDALDIGSSVHDGRDMDPADIYEESSSYSRAVECFEKLVDGDGDDHVAWYNLASARALKGEVAAAAESLEKAISLHEPYRERARQDHDFVTISEDPIIKRLLDGSED